MIFNFVCFPQGTEGVPENGGAPREREPSRVSRLERERVSRRDRDRDGSSRLDENPGKVGGAPEGWTTRRSNLTLCPDERKGLTSFGQKTFVRQTFGPQNIRVYRSIQCSDRRPNFE